jgi:leucyl-tRNA---protein transferase
MRIIHRYITEPHPCAYLEKRIAMLEYSFVESMKAYEYEDLMNRGYRKFGAAFFRPVCGPCQKCRPMRVDVNAFRPDRSQRRNWKRNQDLQVRLADPTIDGQRMELYREYHEVQAGRKGWPLQKMDLEEYRMTFVYNPIPSIEISIWEGSVLCGVVITDVTPNTISGIYHYHDFSQASRGLGIYCMLQLIELARQMGKRWLYFGYYVSGCSSMEYKAAFKPCEILDVDLKWKPFIPEKIKS